MGVSLGDACHTPYFLAYSDNSRRVSALLPGLRRLNAFFHLNNQPVDMRFVKHVPMGAGDIQNLQVSSIILPAGR
jgi:hypothetical protein